MIIVIPTFKRPHLLKLLLQDIVGQSVQPECIVIVDGDPASGDVPRMLKTEVRGDSVTHPEIHYVASNHGNLAYQRYLGWRVADAQGCQILVYLDDDLRINDPLSLEHLIAPMLNNSSEVVGCTGEIRFGDLGHIGNGQPSVRDRHSLSQKPRSMFVRLLGSSRGLRPGDLTPSGHRCSVERSGESEATLQWLRGGVMAYRMSAMVEDCFSTVLFALSEIGCGHGEDTLLSRRIASRGRLLMVFDAVFQHPNADAPKAYATKAFRMAWGSAYSRRLLNDNYRWPDLPTTSDRLALGKSYIGNTLLNFLRAFRSPASHRFAYAWGYCCGALKGTFYPPTHQRLTPHIDWKKDADMAVGQQVEIQINS